MRLSLIILLVLTKANLFAQDLEVYHDTLHHFKIDIPKGWMVNKKMNNDQPALSVRLINIHEGGLIPSYAVNIIEMENMSFEKYYNDVCRPIDSPLEDRVLISEDTLVINGINYRWIHTKSRTLDLLRNLIYYCIKDRRLYQISFSADVPGFVKYEHVFRRVIETFKP